jgi:hypothetical protein
LVYLLILLFPNSYIILINKTQYYIVLYH